MSKFKRIRGFGDSLPESPSGAAEERDASGSEEVAASEESQDFPEPLPVGLKELGGEPKSKEDVLCPNWVKRVEDDGTEMWVCQGDFKVPGGAVSGGTVRTLEEAFALEVKRLG